MKMVKMHPQFINNKENKKAFIVLPIEEYQTIIDIMEEQLDIKEITERMTESQETFPLAIVEKLSNGEHPVKVFREYRGLSQSSLATKVKVSKQYISQIETFTRQGTAAILKSIAKILNVDLDDLIKSD